MINKTNNEIYNFVSNIKTKKSHENLLKYMNNSFYSSIKLLISISSTFSIYWKVVLPFIVSLGALLILASIEPLAQEFRNIINVSYVAIIEFTLIAITFVYIMSSKKYFISCMKNILKTQIFK